MFVALTIGTVLAVAALCYVLYPLFFGMPPLARTAGPRFAARRVPTARAEAIAVLREIEFDRATGKLADADYAELKAEWTRRALEAQRAEDATVAVAAPAVRVDDDPSLDSAERAIRQARANAVACPVDGPRPEPDAVYCSECGRWLAGACHACGAPVTGEGARFCAECGTALAA